MSRLPRSRSRRRRVLSLPVAVVALILLGGASRCRCADDVRPSPASHASWARQVVPKLLGRKVRGRAEVRVLDHLAAAAGKEATARALMESPEFVDHWSDALADLMRVNRAGGKDQRACFGPPRRTGLARSDVAAWIRDHGPACPAPDGTPCPTGYNMSDVLRSSIALDDLSVAYRAYLYPLVSHNHRNAADIDEPTLRNDLMVTLERTYLDRQNFCLGCHNRQFSTSGVPGSGHPWPRTWPVWGAVERALYGADHGIAPRDEHRLSAVLRTDVVTPTGAAPWGMTDCGTFQAPAADDTAHGAPLDAYFAGDRGRRAGIEVVEALLRTGNDRLQREGLVRRSGTVDGARRYDLVEPDAGFAFLVATNAANDVWNELMGSRLTIANHFPRNAAQRDHLWRLTEGSFAGNHWSLRTLLAQIVASDYFARKQPRIGDGVTPYEVPLVFDPWVARDPRPEAGTPATDENEHNAMTDGIHRYSARSLLQSTHKALGWPAPWRFPGEATAAYPSVELSKAMGRFFTDAEPGFRGTDFQGLLAWDRAHQGCARPTAARDWLDELTDAAAGWTVRQVVGAQKDRLLGHTGIAVSGPIDPALDAAATEEAALAALFGVDHLDRRAADVADLPAKVRELCGVLVETPQFLLAGVAPEGYGPEAPVVCPEGRCSYREICDDLVPALAAQGLILTCADDHLSVASRAPSPIAELCPPGVCGFSPLPEPSALACRLDAAACRPIAPPCDPRCAGRLHCCGTPPPIGDVPGELVIWGAGAKVAAAAKATIRGAGDPKWQPLQAGRTLAEGDLLSLAPGSELELSIDGRVLRTPKGGMSGKAGHLVRITGPGATEAPPPPPDGATRAPKVEDLLKGGWFAGGESGLPAPAGRKPITPGDRGKLPK